MFSFTKLKFKSWFCIMKKESVNLYPVHNPGFNLREIVKQMLLLEDHLNRKRMHCYDCIRKHILTIEALAEEAIQLDKTCKSTKKFETILSFIVSFGKKWEAARATACKKRVAQTEVCYQRFAQELRVQRKKHMKEAFEVKLF